MKRFNIALLHYSCPPVVGGVEEVIRQQADLLHRNYHHVKVLAGAGEQFSDKFPIEINPILSSRDTRVQNAHKNCLNGNTEPLIKLKDKIHDYLCSSLKNFDAIIAHNVISMNFSLALTMAMHHLAETHSIKVISWNHDSPYFYKNYPSYLDNEPWKILKTFNSKIHYIAISHSRKNRFQRLFNMKAEISVIPNGIDPFDAFKLHPATVDIIKENSLFSADLIFVQPSRLIPRKNIELSIRVLRAIHDTGINAKLILTGAHDPHGPLEKSYYSDLKNLARSLKVEKDLIVLEDYTLKTSQKIKPDQIFIRDFYLLGDVLFMPSLDEGFGLPLLEAGMTKLPVICSNIKPFIEIGSDNVCSFNLDETPEKIANQALNFLKKIPTHKMYRKVIKNYVWDIIYESHIYPLLIKICSEKNDNINRENL